MAAADCPELEDIAALLDDKLTAEERERIAGHLASCESCYQTFAGAAHFLEDSREGDEEQGSLPSLLLPEEIWEEDSQPTVSLPSAPRRPFEGRRKAARAPRSRGWWAVAAAAALVVVTAGLLLIRWWGAAAMSTERLASLAGGPAAIATVPWEGRVTRGPEERRDQSLEKDSFRLGVRFLDLQLALASGDREKAGNTLRRLNSLLKDVDFAPPDLLSAAEEMRQKLQQGAPPRSFLPATPALEKKATEELVLEPRLVELGSWTEACRLAGAGGRPDLFRERATRRLLDQLIAAGPQDEGALESRAVDVLRNIRKDIDAGRTDPAALGQRCESLLRVLDYD